MAIATISPVSGEVLKSFDELTPDELEDKLARAAAAAESYRLTSVEQRVGWLGRAADNLEKEADSVSRLITTEMGKTFRAAQDEVAKCVRGLRFYAAKGPEFLRNLPADARSVGAKQTYVSYQPIGVVLAVMPWNLPLWQAMRRDVQSGMAFINGNTTSYPEIPFGGVKLSGYGRELSDLGMREFMNAKTVWIGEDAGA